MTKIHVYVYVVTESHNCISKCLSYTSNLISGYIFNLIISLVLTYCTLILNFHFLLARVNKGN